MHTNRRRRRVPVQDLILQARAAATQIDNPVSRKIAASQADSIPLTGAEKSHSRRGDMAKLARKTMRDLPDMDPAQYSDAQSVLRGCADALDSAFEVTSEVSLGRKPRSDYHAAR